MTDAGNPTAPAGLRTGWVSIAELLERQVPMHSAEAVAVVAELCAVLLARNLRAIPQAADVLVDGDGRLSIRSEDGGDPDCAALGRMLHRLLATTSIPARLRLFTLNAVSSNRYRTVSEFATALAAYEVPGREKLIQTAHARWVSMRAEAAPIPGELPLRAESEQDRTPISKMSARRLPRWAVATAGVAAALAIAAGAWSATGAGTPSIPPISLAAISAAVPAAVQQALAWVRAVESSRVAAVAPEPADAKHSRGGKRRNAARTAGAAPAPDVAAATAAIGTTPTADSGATVALDAITMPTGAGRDRPTDDAAVTAAVEDAPEAAPSAPDSFVYSSAYLGVLPPVMLTRQIAPPEALSPGVETVNTIEVLVDEAGDVQQVKLLSRPSAISAAMLLSAAKTWKFRPALDDGRPVKYRLRVDVATTRH